MPIKIFQDFCPSPENVVESKTIADFLFLLTLGPPEIEQLDRYEFKAIYPDSEFLNLKLKTCCIHGKTNKIGEKKKSTIRYRIQCKHVYTDLNPFLIVNALS